MALKHDAQGFLVGDPIDLSKAVADWAAIRDDVRAIRQAVLGIEGALSRISPDGRATVPAAPSGRAREADPTIQAFNEVAQPMARGYELLTGGDKQKRQEGWLRRIYSSLTGFRKDEGLFNKIAAKRLKAIEEKPVAEAGGGGLFGGLLGMLGGLLKRIPGLGALAAGAGGLLARGGGLLAGAGRMAGGAGRGLMGLGRGVLRRIPLIGGLLAGAGAAADIYSSETDDTLTRREKDKNAGKAIGGAGGTIAGMAAGAAAGAFAGPIGMAIGGMVGAFLGDQAGQIIGTTVGGWVNDLRDADIPGKIAAAWDGAVSFIKDGWQEVKGAGLGVWESVKSGWADMTDSLKSAWDGALANLEAGWQAVKDAGNSANDFIKDNTGIDIKAGATQAWSYVSDAATTAWDAVVGAGRAVVDKAVDKTIEIKDKAVELGAKAAEGVKSGVEYLGNNTTVGRGIKAASQGAVALAKKAAPAAERAYNVMAAAAGSALEAIMPKGYRHKAMFDGIKGGDSLTKYGSYTDEEAARIRELKTNGANTSANVAGGMSPEIQDKISAQAKKAGLDPVMMQKIAAMESGGNANAISSTGAIGIYQFTGQTASGVGIKNRFDVDQNIEGGMKLTRQNQAVLKKSGLPVTAENLYMMHQLGPEAAQEVIRGAVDGKTKEELSASTQKAMNLNYGAKSKTAADYIATNKKALDDRYASVTKDAGGAPTAVAKAGDPGPAAQAGPVAGAAPAQALAQASAQQPAQSPAPTATAAHAVVPAPPANPALAQTLTPPATPNYAGPVATPVTASVKVPPVPAGPAAVAAADAPQITVPMASNNSARPPSVVVAGGDAGQDMRDRGIAHIATGGLSGRA